MPTRTTGPRRGHLTLLGRLCSKGQRTRVGPDVGAPEPRAVLAGTQNGAAHGAGASAPWLISKRTEDRCANQSVNTQVKSGTTPNNRHEETSRRRSKHTGCGLSAQWGTVRHEGEVGHTRCGWTTSRT